MSHHCPIGTIRVQAGSPRAQLMRRLFPLGAALFVAALSLTPSTAHAQENDFVVEQFEPLPSQGTNILNIGKSDVIRHLYPSFGLVMHFQDDPFQLVLADDEEDIRQRIVDYQLKAEVWASVGLFDYLEIGFVMPLVLAQEAGDVLTEALEPRSFNSFTTADLRIVPKLKILDAEEFGGFGLGLLVPISLPTGDSESYNSEGRVRFEPRLILDYRTDGGFVVAANVGFQPRQDRQVLNFENTDAFKWGLGLEVPLVRDELALIGSVFGTVAVGADVGASEGRTMPIEALGGVQWWFFEDWVGNIGGGAGLTDGVGSPDFRAFLSVGYTPKKPKIYDADGDGVVDADDKCPLEPEDMDGFQDEDGCPDVDNDGDGVLDVADGDKDNTGFGKCRNDPEDKDGFQDEDGCPEPDNDNDGILDVADGEKDQIGFGKCRNEPEDMDGFEDTDGCPDPDNDKDGILDVADGQKDETGYGKCRNEPENFNEWQDEDGCPDIKPKAVLTETAIQILEKVYFDFDKATIQERSFPLLDEVVRILSENPQVNLVRIEGHTDNIGTRAYNAGLSDRRSKAVMAYLVKKGIEKKRMTAKGYGFDFPIDTNSTQEGRDKNRRVEFNILEIDGKPVENQVIRTKPR
ncbi:MAG TPA: OmpA family protein [Myxococcota bacterium]|nr:OmpA family protein [Myxococcota bacterium]